MELIIYFREFRPWQVTLKFANRYHNTNQAAFYTALGYIIKKIQRFCHGMVYANKKLIEQGWANFSRNGPHLKKF